MDLRRFTCAGLLACSAALVHAAPAAPVVTVGATDIKQLQFDWDAVPRANTYELWFRANPGAQWAKYSTTIAQRPYFRIGLSVHLLDFPAARYYVKACNPSGCSASSEIGVEGLAPDAMGYLKPNGAGNNRWFGHHVALSADGATLAVLTGETLGAQTQSVVVHVYHRTSRTSGWLREARLLPSTVQSFTSDFEHGAPLALSGDGSWLALGVFREDAPGIPDPADTGAVYLFHRDSGTWQLAQKISPSVPRQADWFGYSIDMDDPGRTLAVLRQHPNSAASEYTVEVYRRDSASSAWSRGETLPPPAAVAGLATSCGAFSLSGNGLRLLRTCSTGGPPSFVQVLESPVGTSGWTESARATPSTDGFIDANYDGTRFLTNNGYGLFVWALTASGWSVDANGSLGGYGLQGCSPDNCAISRDGKFLVEGNPDAVSNDLGPELPPYSPSVAKTGAVLVWERKANGWAVRRKVNPGSLNVQGFGRGVALGDNGRILAVGAPFDPSAATGIDGDRDDASAPQRGAVWLY